MNRILDFLERHEKKIVAVLVAVIILTVAFFCGEKPSDTRDNSDKTVYIEAEYSAEKTESDVNGKKDEETTDDKSTEGSTEGENKESTADNTEGQTDTEDSTIENNSENNDEGIDIEKNGEKDNHITDNSQQDGTPSDEEQGGNGTPSDETPDNGEGTLSTEATEDGKTYCTISISCATILDNMGKLDRDKKDLVPADGWILKPVTVEYTQGETVFDLLKRVCMDRKIHMESSWTALYNSAYVEGINNLYEFDCGNLSGWMYSVNDVFPNYGCSKYEIHEGDVIEWLYTCNLGKDIN